MKDLLITIYGGGDEAVEAACELAGIAKERLRLLSQNGDCPDRDNAARQDNNERLAALQALTDIDEELGLPRRTPDTLATPREGREQNGCTLTGAEREAVSEAIAAFDEFAGDEVYVRTLRGLLERMR